MKRFLKNKKGEKELQMIFGLFVLLIISLVVLMLFLKFTRKSTTSMMSAQGNFFAKSKIDEAKQNCQQLCSAIQEDSSQSAAVSFCSKSMKIDYNGDGQARSFTKASEGLFITCEDRVPCFVLVPDCGKSWNPDQEAIFTGDYCKGLLKRVRPDLLSKLMYDSPKATCNLPVQGQEGYQANWVLKFGFYNTSEYAPNGTLVTGK